MKQEHRNLKQRKALILKYLKKHPLSSIREISEKYASKRGNFVSVKKAIDELLKDDKIESLIHKQVYILKPEKNREKDALVRIMSSEKIFHPSFKKLPFDDGFHRSKPLFPQVVEQCINLFHLRFKIFILEIRRIPPKVITAKRLKLLKKTFVRDFLELLKLYSYVRYSVLGDYISVRGKDDPIERDPSQETILIWFSNFILAKYAQDTIYFDMLRFNKKSLEEKIKLLEIATDDSPKEASLRSKTTLKNIRRLLKPLMYDRGKGYGFSFEKAEIYRQAEQDRTLVRGVRNEELSKLLFKVIARRIISKFDTKKQRLSVAAKLKEKLGIDTSKMEDLFDI